MVTSSGERTWSTKLTKHGSHPSGEPQLDSRPVVRGMFLQQPPGPPCLGSHRSVLRPSGPLILHCWSVVWAAEAQCPHRCSWFRLLWVKAFVS